VDHPNLEMAMTVSYVCNGIDGSQSVLISV
jgi:hypothetical protein